MDKKRILEREVDESSQLNHVQKHSIFKSRIYISFPVPSVYREQQHVVIKNATPERTQNLEHKFSLSLRRSYVPDKHYELRAI